jgi:hypothetical protein
MSASFIISFTSRKNQVRIVRLLESRCVLPKPAFHGSCWSSESEMEESESAILLLALGCACNLHRLDIVVKAGWYSGRQRENSGAFK